MKKGLLTIVALLLVVSLVGCVAAPIDKADKQAAPKGNVSETKGTAQLTQTEQTEATVAKKEEIKTDKKEEVKTEDLTETAAQTEPTQKEQTPQRITREEAKAAALKHANVKEADVRDLEIELDKERGVLHYDVSFEVGAKDYAYEINAYAAKVLFSEVEDDAKTEKPKTQTTTLKTKAEAKAIALKHAKVNEADARDLEIELEEEKGVKYYEITFESAGYDYEYIIDGQSGEILHQEKERD